MEVLIDVGACSSYSEQAIEAALLSLLTTGEIGDLAVTEDGFSMRQVGTDTTRKECCEFIIGFCFLLYRSALFQAWILQYVERSSRHF